ncbi:hypothetical protein, partial [Mesorhizobium captivum]|uniref:hypothetical protein n=1 Tax=Mesorhizobium captivum TaxID=3072319 RepID=UPI002A248C10
GWLTLLAIDTRGRYVLRMTRAELYDLVWSKPMTEIARQYGISETSIWRRHAMRMRSLGRVPAIGKE